MKRIPASAALALLLAVPAVAQEGQANAAPMMEVGPSQRPGLTDPSTGMHEDDIAAINAQINAIIAYNRLALSDSHVAARILSDRTVLIKDNIETREFPTTAGSLALADNETGRDAPLVARLRANGARIVGKTNLSEWANIRGSRSSSGWSAVGGQARNPHATDRSPCGSSSGSGAAVAAGLAWAAIGTETDGSITCPASLNGIVGFKPSVGLVSRTHVVPISSSQDTAGPMARSVRDAAMLLTAMAGPDPLDPATAEGAAHVTDFTAGLASASLQGVRVGVLRRQAGGDPRVIALFDQALADMRAAGAELVEIDYTPDPAMGEAEYAVLLYELREGLDAYLQGSPADIPVRSLEQVIAFNSANAAAELRWFGQDIFEASLAATDMAAYREARATSLRLAGAEGIDRLLADYGVSLLVAPTEGPAWPIDLIAGDRFVSPSVGAGSLAAIAGYPHLSVPMGAVERLPVGLSLIGARWQDHAVLQAGAAYERARSAQVPQPRLAPWAVD
ncbi:amidase [Alteraurantiacibacter buctensis]|uniref:Amidase n=1 Tax=Alteraurantiacibacter buctensis TaxID=1503981 RepID=A0A844Z3Z0_9SPHN|nr:amidase [Alteraurantiacibacter buctensis]MXO73307.1 amidase [Alteraurantiacibacter buctensis]